MPGIKVLFDSDALIALINASDPHHKLSENILEQLVASSSTPVIPYAIILEAATALARNKHISRPDLSKKLLIDYADAKLPEEFDPNVGSLVATDYKTNISKKNSPFDHYLCALAKKNSIKYIFSFDSFYKKQGLTLAEELLK